MIGLRSYKIFTHVNMKYINNQTQLQVCRKGLGFRVRSNFRNKISGSQWYSLTCTQEEGPRWWSHGVIHNTTAEYDFSASTWLMTHVWGKPNMWFQIFQCKQKNHATFPILTLVFTVICPNSKTSKKSDHPTFPVQAEGFVVIMFTFSH